MAVELKITANGASAIEAFKKVEEQAVTSTANMKTALNHLAKGTPQIKVFDDGETKKYVTGIEFAYLTLKKTASEISLMNSGMDIQIKQIQEYKKALAQMEAQGTLGDPNSSDARQRELGVYSQFIRDQIKIGEELLKAQRESTKETETSTSALQKEVDQIKLKANALGEYEGRIAKVKFALQEVKSLGLSKANNGQKDDATKLKESYDRLLVKFKEIQAEQDKLNAQAKWDKQVQDIEKNNDYLKQYDSEINAINKTLQAYTGLREQAFKADDGDKLSQTSARIAELRTQYDALIQKQQEIDKQASFDSKEAGIEANYQATMLYGTELDALKEKYRALTSFGKDLFKQGEKERAEEIAQRAREVKTEIERIEATVEKPKQSKIKLLEITKNIIKFQLVMKPLTSLMSGFTRTLNTSMNVAAEAEQIFSKLTTVFGDQATAMSVATTAAQQYGTATSTMANSLSTIGDLLQAQGMGKYESLELAEQWAGFFSDIIAFKDINMSLDEFAQNFMSGAAGNLRNFRSFGSIVRESAVNAELARRGLEDLTGAELERTKVVIRATLALGQQQNALGATSREWDTMLSINRRLNEEWKTFQENLGTDINIKLNPLKSSLAEMLSYFNDIADASNRFAQNLKSVGTFKGTDDEKKSLINALDSDYKVGKGNFLSGAIMTAIGVAISGAAVALTGGIGLAPLLASALFGSVGGTSMWKGAGQMLDQVPSSEELVKYAFAYGLSMEELTEIIRDNSEVYKKNKDAFDKNIKLATEEYAKQLAVVLGFQNLTESLNKASDTLDYLGEAKDNLQLALGGNNQGLVDYLSNTVFTDKLSPEYVLGINLGKAEDNINEATKGLANLYQTYERTITSATRYQSQLEEEKANAFNALVDILGKGFNALNYGKFNIDGKLKWGIDASTGEVIAPTNANGMPLTDEEINTIEELYASYLKLNIECSNLEDTLKAYRGEYEAIIPELERLYNLAEEATKAEQRADFTSKYGSLFQELVQEKEDKTVFAELNAWRKEQESSALSLYEEAKATGAFSNEELNIAYNQLLAQIAKEYNARYDATRSGVFADAKSQLQEWKKGRTPKQYEGKYAEADQWYDEQLAEATQILTDAFTSLGWEGDKLNSKVDETLEYLTPALVREYKARKESIDALEKETRLKELEDFKQGKLEAINPISNYMESYSMGSELNGTLGGIEIVLLDLLAETKLISELSSFVSDYIVPMLDTILEPIRLVLPLVGEMVQALQPILQPVFNVLYAVMPTIAIAVGTAAIVLNTISSFVKMLYQAVTFQFSKIGDTYKEMDEKNHELLTAIGDILVAMRDTENVIAKNTNKDDNGYLKALMDTGLITPEQYYEKSGLLRAGIYSDSVGRFGKTNVGTLNLTISGDFSGMDEERLARYIVEKFDVQTRSSLGY